MQLHHFNQNKPDEKTAFLPAVAAGKWTTGPTQH